jgi:general secretion pathway protein H
MRLAPSHRNSAGFTLLEMLAAMAILALAIGFSAPLLRPPPPGLQLQVLARKLCAALQTTRARAIASNTEIPFIVDLARKSFAAPGLAEAMLPADMRVDLKIAESRRRGAQMGDILFFPSGASSGGEITLSGGGRRALIDVNWLTGATRCQVQ